MDILKEKGYYTANKSILKASPLLLPPNRSSIWNHSINNVMIDSPGGYSGPFDGELVPYFEKVCDAITDRRYRMVVFAGPAQTGKTQTLLINFLLWMIENDPHDVLLLQTSMERARDNSRREIDRALKANKGVRDKMDWSSNNTFAKRLKNGVIVAIQWPSSKVLAGRSLRTIVLTDHDRVTELDEGGVADLSLKRTTVYKSRGKVIVESSPSFNLKEGEGFPDDDSLRHPHDAPSVEGTLGLFNTGTQNRLYLPCPECGAFFLPEPSYDSIWVPKDGTFKERADRTRIVCSANGCMIDPIHQASMRSGSKWVARGQTIDSDGNVEGEEPGVDVASFWMTGLSAGFQSIQNLSMNYLSAMAHYMRTGSETKLSSVTNVDMGVPYYWKANTSSIDPGAYESRAKKETGERGVIPEQAKFIVATVDTQKRRWPVQVVAYGEHSERWVIDRYNIKYSNRMNEDGTTDKVDPATYPEDWKQLIKGVINKEFTQEKTGSIFVPSVVLCDSAGRPGVTENCYRFYRSLKGKQEQKRFVPVKGASRDMQNNIKLTRPDSSKVGDRKTISAGDVPVLMLSPNKIKDGVYADLQREEPGPAYIHLPNWIGSWFFDELVSEHIIDGIWDKIKKSSNNEAWDLLCYAEAAKEYLGYGKVSDWSRPPLWARPKGQSRKPDKPLQKASRTLGNRGRVSA